MTKNSRADSLMPTGTVTFLFTDIEGSTRLWEKHPQTMRLSLARHDALLRRAIVAANGVVFKTVGDAFCAAFTLAEDAVAAAFAAQQALDAEPWPEATPIKVRMALHTGSVEHRDGDYFGPPLNRVARLLATGYGGQTLLSQAAYLLSRDALPTAATLHELGAHRLKDLAQPELVFQLQHADLRADFPPLKSLSTHPNNLPQQVTTFIGRSKELAELDALLAKARLLTLTGAGGSGKTRLGLQVAADALEQFPDGAWLAELASLQDPALVPQVVAAALGIKEAPGEPILETLIQQLQRKTLLLLLDNCEHLLEACARFADALIQRCPGFKVLATSRGALGIAGEQTYRVPSLSLPSPAAVPTAKTLSQYEAVQLFIDRALLVLPGFLVTNSNAPAVASLCWHLDGIPLAIELAAARVRSLSVEEIDRKLDQRFRLLTGGSRTALPRHQTLRALIDWSYDLLKPPERRLFQRLSLFAGGFALEAAETVCAGEEVAEDEVLDRLTLLCDQSLVVAEQTDGHTRYRLLETLRQYARDRLVESGGSDAARARHRDYFLALAVAADPKLRSSEQAAWLRRFEVEHDNFRASLECAIEQRDAAVGLRLCGALQLFWVAHGHLTEGREWCARALANAGSEARTRACAGALNAAGVLASLQGDYPAARARLEESLAIRRESGDRNGLAVAINNLGIIARNQGDFALAQASYEESLEIMRELGDRSGIARALNNLGQTACDQGDYPAAAPMYAEALSIWREVGNRRATAHTLGNLGTLACFRGDLAEARAWHDECLSIMRELEDRRGIAHELNNLGDVVREQGDCRAARALHQESLAILRQLGDKWGIGHSLEELAATLAALGDALGAARLWGVAERLMEEIGAPLPPSELPIYERRVAAARMTFGDDNAFDRAWQEGRAMPLEHAIELAAQT